MPSLKGRHSAEHPQSDARCDQLTPARQRLVRLLQQLNFGTIHHLPIRHGEPVLEPPLRVIRRRKSGTSEPVYLRPSQDTFALKHQWRAFFDDLDAIGDGQVLRIEVAHGLPLIHEFEERLAV